MYRIQFQTLLGAGFGALALTCALFASRGGVPPGLTSSPASNGRNCSLCHGFNEGGGRVELLGAPKRFRTGESYDLVVRVTDPEQAGAGFQISAEGVSGHEGFFEVVDPVHTAFAPGDKTLAFVGHTDEGVSDSIATWGMNGGSYDYRLKWSAPNEGQGPVTFFVSANAINNATALLGDRLYTTHHMTFTTQPPDADGDEDVDLKDWAVLQLCFGANGLGEEVDCSFVDSPPLGEIALPDASALTSAIIGPVSELSAEFLLADSTRGGLLYDTWWTVAGATAPSGNHPLYPPGGPRSGSVTFRCKECHGWDYVGKDGAYGKGSHYTGIRGVWETSKTPQEVFELLRADSAKVPNGHGLLSYGLNESDLWDAVRMVFEGTIDTNLLVRKDRSFKGDAFQGQVVYDNVCASCHGFDGQGLNFGTVSAPVYIGHVARENPWEFLHKTRFGHPGAPMPAFELLGWTPETASDVGAYSATLPTR